MAVHNSDLRIGREDVTGNVLEQIRQLHSYEAINNLRFLGWEIAELEVENLNGSRGTISEPSAAALNLAIHTFSCSLGTGDWNLIYNETFRGLVIKVTYQID